MFISVTAWPLGRVTVAAPFSYEPPAIPIFAAARVSDTSVNTGAPAGKDDATETTPATPLTEIVAFVGRPGTNCAALAGGLDAGTPPAPAAVFAFGEALEVVAHELPFAEVASEPQAVTICCLNGSLLLNLENEINWPALGGSGLVGSETPSSVVDAAGGEPTLGAADEPSSDGGASG